VADVSERLDAALARIAVLEAQHEVVQTLNQYVHAVDYGDMDALLDCYVPDADHLTNLPMGNLKGHQEILSVYRLRPTAPEKFEKHLVVEPMIEVLNADEATADSYYLLVQDRPTGPFVSHYGRYRDRFVRCDDGRWRFKVRSVEGEAIAPGMRK
jgi:ketosteroid isomerase-like protein